MSNKNKKLSVLVMVVFVAGASFWFVTTKLGVGSNTQVASITRSTATGTISVNQTNLHLGDYATFTSTFSPKNLDSKYPGGIRIQVLCYQNGELVYGQAGHYDLKFLLGGASSQWLINGGGASCVADLYYWSYNGGQKFNWVASTAFEVQGKI